MCWRTWRTNRLEVWHGDSLLHSSAPPGGDPPRNDSLRSPKGLYVPVVVAYAAGGLQVLHDNYELVAALPIDGWQPQRGWRFGLGARTSDEGDDHFVDDLRIEAGSAVAAEAVPLEVTFNGVQFTSSGLTFAYERESDGGASPPAPAPAGTRRRLLEAPSDLLEESQADAEAQAREASEAAAAAAAAARGGGRRGGGGGGGGGARGGGRR